MSALITVRAFGIRGTPMANDLILSKFGFCSWNVWGDDIVDRPDNIDETIIATMVNWLQKNGFGDRFYQFQVMNETDTFQGPQSDLRRKAYEAMMPISKEYPDIDYLLVRWRWHLGFGEDERLTRQHSAIQKYLGTKTKIFIWDEDFKMSAKEKEKIFKNAENVFHIEISESALYDPDLIYVPCPLSIDKDAALSKVLDTAGTGAGDHLDATLALAYVGNNYDREEFVQKYIEPTANRLPGRVHLYGNWLKPDTSIWERMPSISYHPKASKLLCDWLYQHATAVPMLAKQIYFDRGHITPRMYEVVSAGGIPIGFANFRGADRYFNIVVNSAEELVQEVLRLQVMTRQQRVDLLSKQIDLLEKNNIFSVDLFFKNLGVSK